MRRVAAFIAYVNPSIYEALDGGAISERESTERGDNLRIWRCVLSVACGKNDLPA